MRSAIRPCLIAVATLAGIVSTAVMAVIGSNNGTCPYGYGNTTAVDVAPDATIYQTHCHRVLSDMFTVYTDDTDVCSLRSLAESTTSKPHTTMPDSTSSAFWAAIGHYDELGYDTASGDAAPSIMSRSLSLYRTGWPLRCFYGIRVDPGDTPSYWHGIHWATIPFTSGTSVQAYSRLYLFGLLANIVIHSAAFYAIGLAAIGRRDRGRQREEQQGELA